MPIYEFQCQKCGATLEALRRMGQGPEGLVCPQCGSKKLEQKFSSFATSAAASSGSSSYGSSGCGGGGGGG